MKSWSASFQAIAALCCHLTSSSNYTPSRFNSLTVFAFWQLSVASCKLNIVYRKFRLELKTVIGMKIGMRFAVESAIETEIVSIVLFFAKMYKT